MPGTRKLGKASEHRRAMMRAMVTQLLQHGRMTTTAPRAKEVQAVAEKMITIAKADDLHARKQLFSYLTSEEVARKTLGEYATKYADRNGGYTRVTKIGARQGDAAEMAVIEFV